ncbi:MAG: hypothetical protein H0W87_06790 [Actinobacteria bacterium]|nr:hypothetical protein [Actinomycetota bacterium]
MPTWKVWYQPHDKFGRRYFSGDLTIDSGLATFEGKKETIRIDSVRAIDRKIVGMNNWIHVAYDSGAEAREAYFLDRRMLGWSGILGGNDKLLAELREALQPG